ncbi:tautomerase family protein [Kitasatospora cineracea]|uniref:tautomerase family protein n=1 Tax=Kitasatospora TaxID=2063 RepID=UPI0004C2C63C|nr:MULTISPECIES: tautomerase family protein [unclassified Kitasatospora]WAL71547.1 tautomerase family protein [Kitasatospora sp. YST-16]WNW37587.1 tautomerase family protein [Streptomyces sp. Li-HN-5-13]
MPLVRIDLADSRPADLRRAIADGVHDALVAVVGIPAGDRFQLLTVHPADELVFDADHLGIRRLDVVYVQITLVAGRPRPLKVELFRRIAANLAAVGVRPEDVHVTLTENTVEDWSVGNGEAQLLALGPVAGTAG